MKIRLSSTVVLAIALVAAACTSTSDVAAGDGDAGATIEWRVSRLSRLG